MNPLPDGAVGLGFRVEVAADLLRDPRAADFVEVVAEACFASPASRREAVALSRVWPVVPHGVKLSLGSAEGIDLDRAKRLGDLAKELRSPVITEHVAFVRAGGREIGHLTQIPFTQEALRVLTRNVAAARRKLPDVPFLLENAAWTFRWPDDEIEEGAFYARVVERTGCDLLLDLGNLHANARNAGRDPMDLLDAYPLDRIAMVHIAGGLLEDGFYFDTHADPVPDGVFDLLAKLVDRIGPVPVVLERDDDFPPFDDLRNELSRARAIVQKGTRGSTSPGGRLARSSSAPASKADDSEAAFACTRAAMDRGQAWVAEMLTSLEEPSPDEVRPFGDHAITRSREVLRRKRVDDALPLLPSLVPHRAALRDLAQACLADTPRAAAHGSVTDAMRVAEAALQRSAMVGPAKRDLLTLKARFMGSVERGLQPRVAPFVGKERMADGKVVWAVKGVGASADVKVFERG
jgi:uncharacterized protein